MSEVVLPDHCGKCEPGECPHLMEWQGIVVGSPPAVSQLIHEFLTPLGYCLIGEEPYHVWSRGSDWSLRLAPYHSPTQVRAAMTPKGNLTHVKLQIVHKDHNASMMRLIWEKSFFAEELRALILFLQTGYSKLNEIIQMHRRTARAVPGGISLFLVISIFLIGIFFLVLYSFVSPKDKTFILDMIIQMFIYIVAYGYARRAYYRFLEVRTGIQSGYERFSEFEPLFRSAVRY